MPPIRQIFIVENRQSESADLLHLGCIGWRIAVDGVDVGLGLQGSGGGLQLAELLDAHHSTQAHVEDQYGRPPCPAWRNRHRLTGIVF